MWWLPLDSTMTKHPHVTVPVKSKLTVPRNLILETQFSSFGSFENQVLRIEFLVETVYLLLTGTVGAAKLLSKRSGLSSYIIMYYVLHNPKQTLYNY